MTTIYHLKQPLIAGTAYYFPAFVFSQADTKLLQTSVTLAAGDVKLAKDNGSFVNLTNLPVETDTSGMLWVTLSTAETTGCTKFATVKFKDAADSEWCDAVYIIGVNEAATVSDGTGITLADDAITAAKIAADAIGASELAADAVAEIAAAAWAYATRTLTVSTDNTDSSNASNITRKRGDSWSISVTFPAAITGYTSLWFTVKNTPSDADTASIIQIKLNEPSASDGLMYVNGVAATVAQASKGSITVVSAAAGTATIALDETITDDLEPGIYTYDLQYLISGDVLSSDAAKFTITGDVTRSVA
jgi:hypothetical protein